MYLNIPVIKLQPGSFKTQLTNKIYEDFDKAIASTNYMNYLDCYPADIPCETAGRPRGSDAPRGRSFLLQKK
jgi:hypothetical protein